MTDIIVAVILAVILTAAVRYVYKAKKSGVKCIGCPVDGGCPHHSGGSESTGCGCGRGGGHPDADSA